MKIEELKEKIREANKKYRLTERTIMEDKQFDSLLEGVKKQISEKEYDEFIELLKKDEIEKSSRKEKLPYKMRSLDKVKTVEEIRHWLHAKNVSADTALILTPKLDGLSLVVDEKNGKAWTRGDGEFGQNSDEHFTKIITGKQGKNITCGEAVMKKEVFEKKYAGKFANARNLVAGQLNSDEPSEILKDIHYVRYNMLDKDTNKKAQLEWCNDLNEYKIPFEYVVYQDLSDEMLKKLYEEWSKDFMIDGIVIDINDVELRDKLKHEGYNPDYARAYKGNFEEVKQARINNIRINVTKQGLLKPIAEIVPTNLDGAKVSNVTLYNYRYVKENNIGVGSIISIKRSGQVIPKVVEVITAIGLEIPKTCPICGQKVEWNETKVDLICVNEDCSSQVYNKILAFFNIMKVEALGSGTLDVVYEAGFDTVEKILKMEQKDFRFLPGFGDKKTENVYNAIHEKMIDASLPQLMHASGCFKGLGERKLALVCHMHNATNEDIAKVKGFSDKSAEQWNIGLTKFEDFVKGLPITIAKQKKEKVVTKSNKCKDMVAVFTGFRSEELELAIKESGGEIGGGITQKTTHLILKDKNSDSGKARKARSLGAKLWNKEELEKFLDEASHE